MKRLRITVEGKTYDVEVELLDESPGTAPTGSKPSSSARASVPVARPATASKSAAPGALAEGDVVSPLAAVVVSVDVAVGDTVEERQKIITLEAMKMNTIVSASVAGTVEAIHVSVGDSVEEGQALVKIS